jgi:prepilin-type N-terminal cleavage/methylation domain-containing protein
VNRSPSTSSAFTLIELVLVLAVMGLLSGAAAIKLSSVLEDVQLDDAVRRAGELDHLARARARNGHVDVQIVWECDKSRAFLQETPDQKTSMAVTRFGRCSIEVLMPGNSRSTSADKTVVAISALGLSRSYAIRVWDPRGTQRYILFAGLTGESSVRNDHNSVQRVFDALGNRQASFSIESDDAR